jgi:hypothetical protein
MLIQNNKNWIKSLVFNFTFVKFIAFSIIYTFSCLFFFIVKFYILKNYKFFYYSGDIQTSDYLYINDLLLVQSHLISIYYVLFLVTIVTLLMVSYRENYFFIEKMELYQSIFSLIVFYSLTCRLLVLLSKSITTASIMFDVFIHLI